LGFTRSEFMFLFLPMSIAVYYCLFKSRKLQNLFLLIISLVFYAWGDRIYIGLLVASIVLNYLFGIWVEYARDKKKHISLIITFSVLINLTILFAFKYVPFTVSSINHLASSSIPVPNIPFPIGISFYTFQAISYIMDVKRGRVNAQRNFINLGLYIAFFPRIVSGPIVRYQTMVDQLDGRKESFKDFTEGVCRFSIGFAKKVILAGSLYEVVNLAFSTEPTQLSVLMAWLGMFASSFLIYFDFSGYSDMAIGLGKMFGFSIPENFNYPYISVSIAEYWRRWHITMSQWFKDYVFLPVTLSKKVKYYPFTGKLIPVTRRITIAMFATWACTGIWHGAAWTFVVWGMYYFVLMVLEKYFPKFKYNWINVTYGFIYTQLAVKFGQVLVRSANISAAGNYYLNLIGQKGASFIDNNFVFYINENKWILIVCLIASMPTVQFFLKYVKINKKVQDIIYPIWIVSIFIVSLAFMIQQGYVPTIYQKF